MGIFNDALKEYGLGSGDKLKLTEGENPIRVLSEPRLIQSTYKGTPTTKFVMWVIDRKDGKVKLFYAPKTIVGYLADLEGNNFYKFDGTPMPYDVVIKAKHAGTIDAEYSIIANPKREPLTGDEEAEFKKQKPIDEVVSKLLETQAGSTDEPAVQVS
jgi:hypothetical protein